MAEDGGSGSTGSIGSLATDAPSLTHTYKAHKGEVSALATWGSLLVSAGGAGDCSLRLWRWTPPLAWTPLQHVLKAHKYGVTCVAWSASGVLVCSGGGCGGVRVWSGRSLAARRQLAAPSAATVRAVRWAGAGVILAAHDDGAVCVWRATGTLVARLRNHAGAVHALAVPGNALLMSACTEGVMNVYDLAEVFRSGSIDGSGSPVAALQREEAAHDLGALTAAASDGAPYAATSGHDATIALWIITGRGGNARVARGGGGAGHGSAVTSLCWGLASSNTAVLASGSMDRTARLWAVRRGSLVCAHVLLAHSRYITAVDVDPLMRFIVTGSNDKTIRTWSVNSFTLEDEIEETCDKFAHFGIGDLEGIEPLDSLDLEQSEEGEPTGAGCLRLWVGGTEDNVINAIDGTHDLFAIAYGDGSVSVHSWSNGLCPHVQRLWVADAHQYGTLGVHLGGTAPRVLLSTGLDATVSVWDLESGCILRSVQANYGEEGVGLAGLAGSGTGGGVREARLCPRRPALLLLVTDDGRAAVWSLDTDDPHPIHMYIREEEGACSCAWGGGGRVAAIGGAGGSLALVSPPPLATSLTRLGDAHDMGLQSCDFAPFNHDSDIEDQEIMLATGGDDDLLKIWTIILQENDLGEIKASIRLSCRVSAHGGGVCSVRWGEAGRGEMVATSGGDGWARVWTARGECLAAVPAGGSVGGAAGAVLLPHGLLLVAARSGVLAMWSIPDAGADLSDDFDDELNLDVRFWTTKGIEKWILEYVTRIPGSLITLESEAQILQNVRDNSMNGSKLLDDALEEVVSLLMEGIDIEDCKENHCLYNRLIEELEWLRLEPIPPDIEARCPHGLRCAASHRVLAAPVAAADGCTYNRAALREWLIAADGCVSAVSGRRMLNARATHNRRARDQVREWLRVQHAETTEE